MEWFCRYRSVVVALSLPHESSELITFLRAYFEPFFEVGEVHQSCSVVAEIIVTFGELPTVPVSAEQITVDGSKGFLHLEGLRWRQDDDMWVWLQPSGAVIHIKKKTNRVQVHAQSNTDLRLVLLRLVEDITSNAIQNNGALILHGAAVVVNGLAVMALGNKGAGKTSFLCEALERFYSTKLANDNVCVFVEQKGITLRGWPSFFKASLGTVISYGALVGYTPKGALLDDDGAVWHTYEKIALYPTEAAEAFSTEITAEAKLGQILLPRFSTEYGVDISQMDPSVMREELAMYLQGIHNPNHPEWLELNPVESWQVTETMNRFVDALSRFAIPLMTLRWGPSLHDQLRRLPLMRDSDKLLTRARFSSRADRKRRLP